METEKEDYPFKVTREETDRYLREVKDQNPIHQGEGAIVPGFLMANKILKQLSPQIPFQAEFRFLTPLQIERSGWLEFLSSDEENDPKIEAEKALKKVQKIHLNRSSWTLQKRLEFSLPFLLTCGSRSCYGNGSVPPAMPGDMVHTASQTCMHCPHPISGCSQLLHRFCLPLPYGPFRFCEDPAPYRYRHYFPL